MANPGPKWVDPYGLSGPVGSRALNRLRAEARATLPLHRPAFPVTPRTDRFSTEDARRVGLGHLRQPRWSWSFAPVSGGASWLLRPWSSFLARSSFLAMARSGGLAARSVTSSTKLSV